MLFLLLGLMPTAGVSAQDGGAGIAVQRISDPTINAWAPAITTDIAGNVHLVWSQTMSGPNGVSEGDTLFYARWSGANLSRPVDVLASPNGLGAEFPMIAVDTKGWLQAIWGTGGITSRLYYSRAPACCADRPQSWSTPRVLAQPILLTADIAVDNKGTIHIVYVSQDTGNPVFHIDSEDSGVTWSLPTRISGDRLLPDDQNVWPRIATDARGRLHAVWSVIPWPGRAVIYARSEDGGATWSPPLTIDDLGISRYKSSGYGPIYISVATSGDDQVYVMWDGAPTIERHMRWSRDGGKIWSAYSTLFPELGGQAGRSGWNDMNVDSNGRLYATSLGSSLGGPLLAYWDGKKWSGTEQLAPTGSGELVRSVITSGNILHVVWVDKRPNMPDANWYLRKTLSAAALPLKPLPIPTPPPTATVVPTATVKPTATRGPAKTPTGSALPSNLPATDLTNPLFSVGIGLVPVLLLFVLVVGGRVRRN